MERERFRTLLLRQALVAGFGCAGAVLLSTSVNDTAGMKAAVILGTACVVAAGIYLLRAWQRSPVLLDERGVTLFALNAWRSWPFEHLEAVKRIGRWHVRLCFGSPAPGEPHEHIDTQLLRADDFADALADWYERTQGHPLPASQDQPAA